MQPLRVEVTNWKKTRAVILLPFLHPVGMLIADLLHGKPLAKSLVGFGVFSLIYLVFGSFVIARMLLSNRIRCIIADENGVQIQAGRSSKRIAWHQIASFERSMRPGGKDLKRTLTLRDAGGAVLAEIPRELQESAHTAAGFEALEAGLVAHVGKRGVIAPSLDAPLAKTSFADTSSQALAGWSALAMFGPGAFLSWQFIPGGAGISAGCLGFALLGAFVIVTSVSYEIDERGVRCQTRFSQRELRWDQIRRVELIRGAGGLNFRGEKQSISVPGPARWGRDGGLLMMFVLRQCQKLGIEWEGDQVTQWRALKKHSTR